MFGWFQALLPKEERFFVLFNRHAELLVRGPETAGAVTLFTATHLGIPVSTTHTITGSIIGIGAARRVSAVRWGVAKDIATAWILTMPATGTTAALVYALAKWIG